MKFIKLFCITLPIMMFANCQNQNTFNSPYGSQIFYSLKSASWAPDSNIFLYDYRKEVITSIGNDLQFGSGLFVKNFESGQVKHLINNVNFFEPLQASFSKSGTKIVMSKFNQLFIYDFIPDSLEITSETIYSLTNSTFVGFPEWSPNDEWVVFERRFIESDTSKIFIMKNDGSEFEELFNGAMPTWHPDGDKILASTLIFDETVESSFLIFDMNTRTITDTVIVTTERLNLFPSFSNDGSQVVFQVIDGNGVSEIMTMNTDGTSLTSIGLGGQPKWSPDGTKILYFYNSNDGGRIWMMNPDGTNNVRVTSIAEIENPNN